MRMDPPQKDLCPSLATSTFRFSLKYPATRGSWRAYVSTILSLVERQRVDESAQDNWKVAAEQSVMSWAHAGLHVRRAMDDLAGTKSAKS